MIYNFQEKSISVNICTLNEEKNIEKCIDSVRQNDILEVIVIDGGSTDKTVEIAKKFADKVIQVERKGLAFQRQIGIDNSKGEYIALIDSDHRVTKNCLNNLVTEMNENKYDGIEAQILSVKNKTYWDWAMEQNFILTHNFPRETNMIGTPCVYAAEVLKKEKFDPFFTAAGDDTDLCYRLSKKGYRLGVGSCTVYQEHRSDFKSFMKKWIWYGKGDSQFALKHPERRKSIIFHPIINYAIKKSIIAIKSGRMNMVPFFIFAGLFRHYGFVKNYIILLINHGKDNSIYST
jgi:glycosyltransferase involved in cell wall biosynthesis